MSFETVLPVLSTLVPDAIYDSGILSVKFKALASRVVFFRPFVSRKSSNGHFVERVVAVFPNGELHLFDVDAKPKRGALLADVTSVVSEGSTVVLIFAGSEHEDLQLRFDSMPGGQAASTSRVVIHEDPTSSSAASASPASRHTRGEASSGLSTAKHFASVVRHYSPHVARLTDVPIDDLELDLQKPANYARPMNVVAASLPVFSKRPPPQTADGAAAAAAQAGGRATGAGAPTARDAVPPAWAAAGPNDETASLRSSVGDRALLSDHGDDDGGSHSVTDATQQQQQELPSGPRMAFLDLVSSREMTYGLQDPGAGEAPLSPQQLGRMQSANAVMFGHLKGMLDGVTGPAGGSAQEAPPGTGPDSAAPEALHPDIPRTLSSLQYKALIAEKLRSQNNREGFLGRQRSLAAMAAAPPSQSFHDPTAADTAEGAGRPQARSFVDFETLFGGSAAMGLAGKPAAPGVAEELLDQAQDQSPFQVLERLRAKHTELTVQNLMLRGELGGLEHVQCIVAQDHAIAFDLSPAAGASLRGARGFNQLSVDSITLYGREQAQGAAPPPSTASAVQLIATKNYQRAINLSVLVLNICRKRRQAVLQAVRQSRIEEERRALEGQYFVSSGLPMAMLSAQY